MLAMASVMAANQAETINYLARATGCLLWMASKKWMLGKKLLITFFTCMAS